jgi:hypothetical protein
MRRFAVVVMWIGVAFLAALLVLIITLTVRTPARAHSFYSTQCCADKDCHPVACEEIQPIDDGWRWRGIKFDRVTLKVSPDGACHVCVSESAHSTVVPFGLCIYLPFQM